MSARKRANPILSDVPPDTLADPPVSAVPTPVRIIEGGIVNFVMPVEPHRIRAARIVTVYRRDRLALDVDVDPGEDGLPTPFRYPMVDKGEPHQPGTWH